MFRAIFRACHARFKHCASKEKYISRVSLEANPGRQRKSVWGLKNEEFMADFCLVSRRVLSDPQYRIFTWHFLHGADWKTCCQRLDIDRGAFFHEVYRIEEKLGKTFRELEPHSLFPIDEYFNSTGREKETAAGPHLVEATALTPKTKTVVKFPLKRVA